MRVMTIATTLVPPYQKLEKRRARSAGKSSAGKIPAMKKMKA